MEKKVLSLPSALSYSVGLEKRRLSEIEEELLSMPDGRISVSHKGSSAFFTETVGRTRRGITRNTDLVYRLARKRYLQLMRERIRAELKSISASSANAEAVSMKIVSLLDDFSKAGLDISRITLTPKQYSWMHADYRRNSAYPEELNYKTDSGTKVRSKSERTISNRLLVFGLAFRYEQQVELDVSSIQGLRGTRMGKYKTYSPDFIIMSMPGEYIVWEHLGLADRPEYRESNFEKLFIYRQLGYVSEKNMITTFESDLNDVSVIDDIIVRRILLGY